MNTGIIEGKGNLDLISHLSSYLLQSVTDVIGVEGVPAKMPVYDSTEW